MLHPKNKNHLLAALDPKELDRLRLKLELVSLAAGEILYESGQELGYAYFPTTCIISLQYVLENGAAGELAGIGNEGMLGVSLFMGGSSPPSRAFVRTAGEAYRLRPAHLLAQFNEAGQTMRVLLLYTQALITHISQTAICNRRHTIEQQLCRWLLQTLDHSCSSDLAITQEVIAGILGVRREGITEAAQRLQSKNLIQYRRGHIKIIDRVLLKRYSCECYSVVKDEFNRLFSGYQSHADVRLVLRERNDFAPATLDCVDGENNVLDLTKMYARVKPKKKIGKHHGATYIVPEEIHNAGKFPV